MNHAKILDCTLRDGAYLVDKHFGNATIMGIIDGLVKTKVDFIEIGFLQNEGQGDGKTVYKNAADAQKFVPEDKQGCEFTVLADYSRYSIENLDECTGQSIDAVRECFFKDERFEALEVCRIIKQKGYKVFVQPVDILGYSDVELLELIERINEIEPYCLSIVDTFGSMYTEDLHRVFELINHNLISTCRIGFHSHNNMQMSNALSQEFLRLSLNKREVVVDGTISGMGRGAGNTPTELVVQYMVSKLGYNYDIDALLDVIDGYMDNIKARCTWGYSTPYFIAGSYGAHVNNVSYLLQKNSIRSKDIRYILNKIGEVPRKRYDYDLLEKTYLDYLSSEIDDLQYLQRLSDIMKDKEVLLLVPGNTVSSQAEKIKQYINENKPMIISVNFLHDSIKSDYLYLSNVNRYNYWKNDNRFKEQKKIYASNIARKSANDNDVVVSFTKLIKCGWEYLDNSTLMLLRLLDCLPITKISIAGFDGYECGNAAGVFNYANTELELSNVRDNSIRLNDEIRSMLEDYLMTRVSEVPIEFITDSRFQDIFKE